MKSHHCTSNERKSLDSMYFPSLPSNKLTTCIIESVLNKRIPYFNLLTSVDTYFCDIFSTSPTSVWVQFMYCTIFVSFRYGQAHVTY